MTNPIIEADRARTGVVPWPAELAAKYAAAGYWRGEPLGHWMWTWADRYGDRTAIVDGRHRIGYRRLAEHADALADSLAALGLRNGDNILVQLPNCWEFMVLFLACQRIGVAPVLTLLAHRAHELRYLAELAEVGAIVVPSTWQGFDHQGLAADLAASSDRNCPVLVLGDGIRDGHIDLRSVMGPAEDAEALRRRLDSMAPSPGEVALFLLSGGTTGVSKIIARTHNDYEYNARRSAEVCGFDADTVYLATLPIAHNFPLGSPGTLGTLMNGGRVVMARSARPEVAFPLIERERVTVSSLVPAIAQRWVEAAAVSRQAIASLRMVQVGGSVLPPESAALIERELGCAIQQVYGMAEGLLSYTSPGDPPEVSHFTQGRPICADDEILIVDERGLPVPDGAPGELLTRGPCTPRGYFRAAEHNARAFTPDGWYRTGDIVQVHPTGNVVVVGRIKDLINRGGEKISAPEVETLMLTLPQVRQAGVVPVPDDELGERVAAFVALHPGHTLSLKELRDALSERGLGRYKLPERLEILPELPLTGVGKPDKKSLRRTLADR
jgi:2,3-dihydroxybenzoate-AMP ligase